MGCAPCLAQAAAQAARTRVAKKEETSPSEECQFTIEQVSNWLEKVKCVQSQGLYTQIPNITKKQINIYLSTLLSARNYASKPCYFKNELEEVESFITILIALDLCNN